MTGTRFRLPRILVWGAGLGGLSCLILAGLAGNEWVQVGLMAMSAMHWLLLIDATRCGIWVRDDGMDIRVPLQGGFRRIGWRDVESMERTQRGKRERLVLHLVDDRKLGLPIMRDGDRLAELIEEHLA